MSKRNLFERMVFIAAGGDRLTWKIECDALTREDWMTIAEAMIDRVPPFNMAYGVPTGGSHLAFFMREYATPGAKQVLVCDDVWTTGKTMRNFVETNQFDRWHGLVAFARGELDPNVTCFMQHDLDQRSARIGALILRDAQSLGWKDDGEGAYEFMMRMARRVGLEDRTPAVAGKLALCERCGGSCGHTIQKDPE